LRSWRGSDAEAFRCIPAGRLERYADREMDFADATLVCGSPI
jgi:hypothetical protein